jgi:5-methylcytosine-specific restriction protein B
MIDYEKFKKLLEYFVSHLQYEVNAIDERDFIKRFPNLKELFDKKRFFNSGQGYKGQTIQSQISPWDKYSIGTICINITATSFTGRGSYLNWEETSDNILAIWNDSKNDIIGLQLAICHMSGKKGSWENVGEVNTLENLGLFDNFPPNPTIKTFFDNYCKMYRPQLYNNMKIVNLLSNKNLILTGAPGVGKTYKTAEIAVAIIDGIGKLPSERKDLMTRYKELIKRELIVFTTFHQSLDYEEFVEGLKPELDDNGNSTGNFRVKNGIFKDVCEKAKENFYNSQKTQEQLNKESHLGNFVRDFLIDAIDNNTEFETTFHKIKFWITDFENNSIQIKHGNFNSWDSVPKNEFHKISFKDLLTILSCSEKFNEKREFESVLNRKVYNRDNYLFSLYENIYADFNKNIKDENITSTIIDRQNFVLIIDEINRGNISKVFGELITLMEKDKRIGAENEITVTLPYSQEEFGVPSNLYIIGTMNTADRSIGAIDYALRRRFAFVPLKSEKNVISSYDKYQENTKSKAENLFDAIKTFIESNINEDLDAKDLMVGHSYFLCETEDDLKHRLEYEIIPLLWEYQKDGIITCERKILNEKVEKWLNFDFSEVEIVPTVEKEAETSYDDE